MRTILPDSISNEEEAKKFLRELINNNESFNPEDNPHDICWQTTTLSDVEKDKLTILMQQIWKLPGFDPFLHMRTR